MSTTADIFEIAPFQHEFEAGARFVRGARAVSRGRTSAPKPALVPKAARFTHAVDLSRLGRPSACNRCGTSSGARAVIRRIIGVCPLAAIHT